MANLLGQIILWAKATFVGDEVPADGQPLYDKANKRLHLGDGTKTTDEQRTDGDYLPSRAEVDVLVSAGVGSIAAAVVDITNIVDEHGSNNVWQFNDSTTAGDPLNGNLRFNSATIADVTEIYIDNNDQSTQNRSAWVALWSGILLLQTNYLRTSPGVWESKRLPVVFRITGVTVNSGYLTIAVEYVSGALPSNGDALVPSLSPGASGGGSGDYLPLAGGTMDADAEIALANGARIQEGTTDQGTGGNGGISLRCSVDYELNYQAGVLTAYEQDGATERQLDLRSSLRLTGMGANIQDASGAASVLPTERQLTNADSDVAIDWSGSHPKISKQIIPINDSYHVLKGTETTVLAQGSDYTQVVDGGNMAVGFQVYLKNEATVAMTFYPDGEAQTVIQPGGCALFQHKGAGLWMDLLAGKADGVGTVCIIKMTNVTGDAPTLQYLSNTMGATFTSNMNDPGDFYFESSVPFDETTTFVTASPALNAVLSGIDAIVGGSNLIYVKTYLAGVITDGVYPVWLIKIEKLAN